MVLEKMEEELSTQTLEGVCSSDVQRHRLQKASPPSYKARQLRNRFFIRYDNRIAHMITKTAQAQD